MTVKEELEQIDNELPIILNDVNNALLTKQVESAETFIEIPERIRQIEQGVDPSDATAGIFDVVMGKTFYGARGKETGAMQIQSGKQITPSTRDQRVPGARYLGGDIVVLGEPNLLPENIPEDLTLFGVQGTRKMSGGEDGQYLIAFCDAFQLKGTRTNYANAFDCIAGQIWTKEAWKFFYDIKPQNAIAMFRGMQWEEPVDFVEFLMDLDIEIDYSNTTNMQACYRNCKSFTRLGIINASYSANILQLFYQSEGTSSPLRKIDKFKFPKHADLSTVFVGQTNLVECDFEGIIGGRSQNLSYCPFDAKTVRSIFACLENYKDTEHKHEYSLQLSDTAWANVNADTDNPPPNGNTWQDYVYSLGWTY